MNAGIHAVFVLLSSGPLVLAFAAATLLLAVRRRPGSSAVAAADAVAFYSSLVGLIAMIPAIISGFALRTLEASINSPITRNKILLIVLAATCWASFLAIRLRAGPALWSRGFIVHYSYVMVLAGMLFLTGANAIGGDIAGIPSGFERLVQAAGFHTRHTLYFPAVVNAAMVAIGAFALLWSLWRRRAKG